MGGDHAVGRDIQLVIEEPYAQRLNSQHNDNGQDDVDIDGGGKGALLLPEIALAQSKGDETAGCRTERAGEQGEHGHQATNNIVDAVVVDSQRAKRNTCREEADKHHHEHAHIQHHRVLGDAFVIFGNGRHYDGYWLLAFGFWLLALPY